MDSRLKIPISRDWSQWIVWEGNTATIIQFQSAKSTNSRLMCEWWLFRTSRWYPQPALCFVCWLKIFSSYSNMCLLLLQLFWEIENQMQFFTGLKSFSQMSWRSEDSSWYISPGGRNVPSAQIAAIRVINSLLPSCAGPINCFDWSISKGTIRFILLRRSSRNPFSSILYIFSVEILYFLMTSAN